MFYALFFLFIAADFLRPIEPPEKPEAAITMLDIATDFRGIKFRSKPNLGKGYFFYEKDGDTLVYRKAKDYMNVKLGEGYLKEGSERVVWFGDNAYLILKREDDGTGRLMMFDRETVLEIKRAPVEGL